MCYMDTKNYNIYFDIRDTRIDAPLFEIDEMIAPVIQILNRKGYNTQFCCSGHINSCEYPTCTTEHIDCYIVFNVDSKVLMKIPKGFKKNLDDFDRITIRKRYKYDGLDRWYEIINTMKDLIKWAEELE